MRQLVKIYVVVMALMLMGATCLAKNPKSTHHNCCKIHGSFLGFSKGLSLFDIQKPGGRKKYATAITSGFMVNLPLVTRFRAEAGVSFSHVLTYERAKQTSGPLSIMQPMAMSFPLTVQYYVLPKKCRVQPFVGAGILWHPTVVGNPTTLQNNEAFIAYPGTKYISLLFTQGISFEVNPKIHLTETLHFINSSGGNNFGMSFGISFYLP